MNQHFKYLGQRWFYSKLIIWTCRHTQSTALPKVLSNNNGSHKSH